MALNKARFCWKEPAAKKLLLCMKLTAIILLATALQVSATGMAQRVTLSYKNAPVKKVFKEIIRQTGVSIIYKESQLQQLTRVSIDVKEVSLEEALKVCFKDQPYSFQVLDNTVVISQVGTGTQDPEKARTTINSLAIQVTGIVLSSENSPLPEASVMLKGTAIGTVTDANGNFSLEVPVNNGVLVISYVGYTTQEVAFSKSEHLRVLLSPTDKKIDDIVVIGYGTQKRGNLTAAVTQVDAKDFKGISTTGVAQAMQGRVPGMQVYRSSGAPGADAVINIRGIGSFTNNSPLIVVDGVPAGSLNTISPDEVESVTVLKDASASAIYGANGANGVILVTTKAGKTGKIQIDYSYKGGINQAAYMPRLLNGREFALLQNEARINAGQMPLYTDEQLKNMGTGTDWRDAILQTGNRQEHYIAAKGGTTAVKYLLSASYLDENGIAVYS